MHENIRVTQARREYGRRESLEIFAESRESPSDALVRRQPDILGLSLRITARAVHHDLTCDV